MKILKGIIEFILGTSIIWLPITGCSIADWLSAKITMDMIMTAVYISIPVLILYLLICEIIENKIERRIKKHGKVR